MKTSKIFMICIILAFSFYSLFQDLAASELKNNQSSKIYTIDSESASLMFLKNYYKIDLSNIELNNSEANNFFLEEKESTNVSNKSPWLAFILSYMFPGSGQIYNGEIWKGLAFMGAFVAGAVIAYVGLWASTSENVDHPLVWTGLIIGGGAYLWQVIDAPITANNINERNSAKLTLLNKRLLEYQKINFGLSAGLLYEKYSLELNFKYNIP